MVVSIWTVPVLRVRTILLHCCAVQAIYPYQPKACFINTKHIAIRSLSNTHKLSSPFLQSPITTALCGHSNNSVTDAEEKSTEAQTTTKEDRTVTILSRGPNHIVALKPPSVVCHHSGYAGSRPGSNGRKNKKKKKKNIKGEWVVDEEEVEVPMLQRVRDAIHDINSRRGDDNNGGAHERRRGGDQSDSDSDGKDEEIKKRRVNLIHRLDRGASGALLLTYADDETNTDGESSTTSIDDGTTDSTDSTDSVSSKAATSSLISSLASTEAVKTYVALVRGEGIFKGDDLRQKGWFDVTRPIKDEKGVEKEATTLFRFVAGQAEGDWGEEEEGLHLGSLGGERGEIGGVDRPRMSLVLARPKQGRWHQIRKHLNGISHPILGDNEHGSSKINREWKEKRNLPYERICLHMARLQLPPSTACPSGLDVACPFPPDMRAMLDVYAPSVLRNSLTVLTEEGVLIDPPEGVEYEVGTYEVPDPPPEEEEMDEKVVLLETGDHYVVAMKPPSVVVHHSSWTDGPGGKRRGRRWGGDGQWREWNRKREPTPMLQRVRDATGGRRVNLVHRLDRGASGCLVFAFVQNTTDPSVDSTDTFSSDSDIDSDIDSKDNDDKEEKSNKRRPSCSVTRTLIEAMQSPEATKTYIALCDGDGTWNGEDFLKRGWFNIGNPVKDEWGKTIENCSTDVRFLTSRILPPSTSVNGDNDRPESTEGRKICVVLARPHTGRWHQIRQHLASGTIGHAILGDTSHGRSRTNRIWRKVRGMAKERTCLHLAKVTIPKTEFCIEGVDVVCPLPDDFEKMLTKIKDGGMEGLWEEVRSMMVEEGIDV